MDADPLAAGLTAGGLLLAAVAGVATPPGLYQVPDHGARLEIIKAARARFVAAQALWISMLVVPVAGFLLAGAAALALAGPFRRSAYHRPDASLHAARGRACRRARPRPAWP
jgi:hypothetical protein